MNVWQIGNVKITRIVEIESTGGSRFILPDATRDACQPLTWMYPHFMDEAEHCDNLGLIYSGILLAYGTPGEMKKAIPGNLFSIRTEDPFFLLETLKSRNSGIMDAYIYGRSLRILSYSETLSIPGEMAFEKIDPSLQDVFVYHVREGEKRNAIRAGKR